MHCIQVLGSNLVPETDRIVLNLVRPWLLLAATFTFHNSLITLSFSAAKTELLMWFQASTAK